jgi:hypothetical protein
MRIEEHGLESVSESWRQAWSLPKYQIPGPDFDEAPLQDLENPLQDPGLLRGSSFALLEVALMMLLHGGHEQRVAAIVERVRAAQPGLFEALEIIPAPIKDEAIEIRLHVALMTGLLEPRLPSSETLSDLAGRFLSEQVVSKKIGSLHSVYQSRARLVAHAAVLADDFELLSRIMKQTTPAMVSKSPHWMLYGSLAKSASQTTGRSLAGVIGGDPCSALLRQLLQWHRYPSVQAQLGPEGAIGGRPIIGNYLYSWCFVRFCAPDLERDLNWPTFRALMAG